MTGITNIQTQGQSASEVLPTIKLPVWKNLVDAAVAWEYNSTHSFDEISQIIKIPYEKAAFRSTIARANEELTPMGKRLKNVRGVGYMVLDPERYLDEAVFHIKKGARQISRSHGIASGCRLDLVTDHKRQSVIEFRDWVRHRFVDSISDVTKWIEIAKNPESVKMIPERRN